MSKLGCPQTFFGLHKLKKKSMNIPYFFVDFFLFFPSKYLNKGCVKRTTSAFSCEQRYSNFSKCTHPILKMCTAWNISRLTKPTLTNNILYEFLHYVDELTVLIKSKNVKTRVSTNFLWFT